MTSGSDPFDPPSPASAADPAAASRPTLVAAARDARYRVVEVLGDDALARRLASAGLWPGAELERIARAPFGDPLLFRVHGYRLALRRSEAARVVIEPVEVAR